MIASTGAHLRQDAVSGMFLDSLRSCVVDYGERFEVLCFV